MLTKRIGIDLGTSNIRVYLAGQGIMVNEPCVAALSEDKKIIAMGQEAKEMFGRTPENITAVHPLIDGVIANFGVVSSLLTYYLSKVLGSYRFFRPDVMVAIPAGITSTERRAVIDAAMSAGARKAYVIKVPIAAALGVELPVSLASGSMIVDCGGGTTEVAVLSLGGIVTSNSIRIGGNELNEAIANFIRKKYNIIIGEQTAEEIKITIGSVLPTEEATMEISGSNSITGLPETIVISSSEVTEALREGIKDIINAVKNVLSNIPPELAADVIDKGIVMTGGGSLLRNIDILLSRVIGVPVHVASEPDLAVVKGTGVALENLQTYKKSLFWKTK